MSRRKKINPEDIVMIPVADKSTSGTMSVPLLKKEELSIIIEKFVRKSSEDACWNWTGARNGEGYGYIKTGGRVYRAHRLIKFNVDYSTGVDTSLVLDHTCCNKACVNPAHLELVSQRENTVRYVQRKGETK